MDIKKAQNITYIVNTVILILVFGLMGFFYMGHATFLVYFSIPTAFVYIIGFYLIYREKLDLYVRIVYIWLTLYMCTTTLCLGYNFGFHLYCMSMIPVIFVTEYITFKLGRPKFGATRVSIAIAIAYILCTGYVGAFRPIYSVDQKFTMVFWITNALIVFCFLIFYSSWMIKLVIQSENKLSEMAHIDKLTGLYNRHYMLEQLELSDNSNNNKFVAIADIDSFKKINDTYGHNAGDYILSHIAEIMKDACKDCIVSRWGGEEFLLLFPGGNIDSALKNNTDFSKDNGVRQMENLRKTVEKSEFVFEGTKIDVTITIGLADYAPELTIDKWVQQADEGLYYGKTHGKNQVVKI